MFSVSKFFPSEFFVIRYHVLNSLTMQFLTVLVIGIMAVTLESCCISNYHVFTFSLDQIYFNIDIEFNRMVHC